MSFEHGERSHLEPDDEVDGSAELPSAVDEEGLFEPDQALRNARAQLAGVLGESQTSEPGLPPAQQLSFPPHATASTRAAGEADIETPELVGEEDGLEVSSGDTIRPEPIEEDADDLELGSDTERPVETPTSIERAKARAADEAAESDLDAESDSDDPRFETTDDPRIPGEKMFFKIGEVAKMTGVKPYVLRYWETEFQWIRPTKTSSRQRLYRRQDIALIFKIKRLRYDEQLTIAAARDRIKAERSSRSTKKKKKAQVAPQPSSPVAAPFAMTELMVALADMRRSVLDLMEVVED